MMSETHGFTPEQQSYMQGFALGSDVARKIRGLPILSGSAYTGTMPSPATVTLGMTAPAGSGANGTRPRPVPNPEQIHFDAQQRQLDAGEVLCSEELAKRTKNPLDMWDEIQQRAQDGTFPSGSDVFLQKYHGLFYVAPAQDAYMCRLRFPGGGVNSYQLRGIADLCDRFAGGYADVTTRANLQLREIGPKNPLNILMGLRDLGIINTGAGADNIRNITASPLSGLDATELIETLPLARALHYHILHHRELYGLPRKFNIAFDGGGAISSLDDTNDIGLCAVRVDAASATSDCPEGIYFRLALGGITGHGSFARLTNLYIRPDECIAVTSAIIRVYIEHGDRTNRKKARLKYLLEDWGMEKFLSEVEQRLSVPLRHGLSTTESLGPAEQRLAHIGFHTQRQPSRFYVGIVLPVGRMTSEQLRGLAEIAERFGSGEVRLTVWQNLLIPNIHETQIPAVKQAIENLGLDWQSSNVRAGLVACTGNAGCKYAAADTKRHAMYLAEYVEQRLDLDVPINIHLTGCHHSCAQHYIGDSGQMTLPARFDAADNFPANAQ